MAIDDQLKRRVAMLEVEQERQQDEVNQLTNIITEKKEKPVQKQKSSGYAISLDFGGGAPVSEWSDETHGWRTQGLGTRYPTRELADRKLIQLKKNWPDYPFKISLS
jgi:hypothetical protein